MVQYFSTHDKALDYLYCTYDIIAGFFRRVPVVGPST